MGAQRAGPPRGDKYPLAASECTTVSPLGQVEYRAKYRLSYPRGRRPGAAARQSPAGTRVSSPPSALRIARAVVQALTDRARCARSRWPPCVAAVSADPGRSLTPPRAAAVPGDPPRGAVAGAAKGGIGDRGCAAAHSHTADMYVRYRSRSSGGVYYARAAYLTRHRLIGYDEYY
jgi:hypothetical protein